MKSLLVDALRQLEQGNSTAANEPSADPVEGADELLQPEETAAEVTLELTDDADPASPGGAGGPELPGSTPDEAPGHSAEFELTDDTPAVGQADVAAADPVLDTGELALAADEDVRDDTHPLASTMSLDVEAAEDTRPAALPQRVAAETVDIPVTTTVDTPRLQRLATFTPLLCLFLGSVSAGSYFAYSLAVNLNTDLGALPAHVSDRIDPGAPIADDKVLFSLDPAAAAPPPRPVAGVPTGPASTTVPASSATPANAPQYVPVQKVSQSPEDLAYPLVEEAYLAWQSGDTGSAESLYREAIEIAPRHANALLGLAAVLQNSGRVEESLPVYEAVLSLEPDNAAAAAALIAGDGSIVEIRSLLERHPESAPIHFALGSALAGRSRWADARLAFEAAVARAPSRAEYAFNLAVSFDRVGQYAEARGMYERALMLLDDGATVNRDIVVTRLGELSSMQAGTQQ